MQELETSPEGAHLQGILEQRMKDKVIRRSKVCHMYPYIEINFF
jgi:hypothetical protein